MKITYKNCNQILIVKISGEIDEHSANALRKNLDQIFSENSMNKVVFDLAGVDFMDSTGIGLLVGRYKLLKSRRIPAYILNPSFCVEKIFSMTKLYDIMPKVSEC